MHMTRREFIKTGSLSLLLVALSGPLGLLEWEKKAHAATSGNVLVVLQLSGGNDGLNTVVPYTVGAYYDNRPSLALQPGEVLALDNQFGLHPSLIGLKSLWDQNKLAIINGVGYANPDRSHFRSQDIWQSAVPDRIDMSTGWLGRYHDLLPDSERHPLSGMSIGSSSKIYYSKRTDVPQLQDVATYQLLLRANVQSEMDRRRIAFENMYLPTGTIEPGALTTVRMKGNTAVQSSKVIQSNVPSTVTGYPNSHIGKQLSLIAALIGSGTGTRTFFTETGNFDDHTYEKGNHAKVLTDVDSSLTAFWNDLTQRGIADRVTVLIYSEFGRRPKENASSGTDHGTAAPVLILGNSVQGGLYGQMPSLTTLDIYGDLKYTVDFRSVYATLLDRWLGMPSFDVLGGTFENVPYLL